MSKLQAGLESFDTDVMKDAKEAAARFMAKAKKEAKEAADKYMG